MSPIHARPVQVAGGDFVFVLRGDGSVAGFGREGFFAGRPLGTPVTTPTTLALPPHVKQMAISFDAAYALTDDGTLYAWGTNDRGQFGKGVGSSRTPDNPMRSGTPVRVPLPKSITEIRAAGHHALALATDGTVLTWGSAPAADAIQPRVVEGIQNAVQIAAAGTHDLALTKDGVVLAWGENRNGQLGIDMATLRSERPVQVQGLASVVSIGAHGTSSFGFSGAVKADGTVWMWGSNQSATLGNGLRWGTLGPDNTTNYPKPEMVKGITTAKSISIGTGTVVVLMADRTLRVWGHDGWGQAGVNTHGGYQESPRTPAITDVIYATSQGTAVYAVRADGTLWRWGTAQVNTRAVDLGNDRYVPTLLPLP